MIDIDGYNVIRYDRNWSDVPNSSNVKRGGGVCTYIKEGLNYIPCIIPELNVSTKDLECQCFEIKFTNQKIVVFVTIYRPPQGKVDIFIRTLDTALQSIDLANKDLILLVDFNIDFLEQSNSDTKDVNRLVSENGLVKLISSPTRYSNLKNSCIDQIVTQNMYGNLVLQM